MREERPLRPPLPKLIAELEATCPRAPPAHDGSLPGGGDIGRGTGQGRNTGGGRGPAPSPTPPPSKPGGKPVFNFSRSRRPTPPTVGLALTPEETQLVERRRVAAAEKAQREEAARAAEECGCPPP